MNVFKLGRTAFLSAVLFALGYVWLLPALAQDVSGKQKQAEAISSSRDALNGRLFFSREQRERLDRVRSGGEASSEQIAIEPRASRINGFVKRSDGETAVWVDGRVSPIPPGQIENITPSVVGGSGSSLRVAMASASSPTATKVAVTKPSAKRVRKASSAKRARSLGLKRN